jgi:4-hydroxyphenylpyruvate dioxygenase-like putative hemolysin
MSETTRQHTDTPPQAVNHIDHVGIVVYRENLSKYVQRLSDLLGVEFDEPIVNEGAGCIAALSWGSGFEIMAPIRNEGRYWDRLQRFGEGTCTIIFGVPDIDAAIKRARSQGAEVDFVAKLEGDEPWLARFSSFREARLNAFDDGFSATLSLSEIVPA